VLVFGGLNPLEIACFGNVGHVPQAWGAMLPSHPGGAVELTAEGGQVGGPPRFGVVGGPGDWRVFL